MAPDPCGRSSVANMDRTRRRVRTTTGSFTALSLAALSLAAVLNVELLVGRVTGAGAAAAATRVTSSAVVSADTRQLLVAITPSWSASSAIVQRYERRAKAWVRIGVPWAARVAPKGSTWGRGRHPVPSDGTSRKAEGDDRTPAGVFEFGSAFGYDAMWATKTKVPFVTVGVRDLFVEDPQSPSYNQHVRLDHDPRAGWETAQQMNQSDPAHQLKILVRHNADPVVAGEGSAIFLHVWRTDRNGAPSATAGCTAMALHDVERVLRWLDPSAHPLFVLLPGPEYERYRVGWGLPAV